MAFWEIVGQILLESLAETLQEQGYCDNRQPLIRPVRQRRIASNQTPISDSLQAAAESIDQTAAFVREQEPMPPDVLKRNGTKVLEAQIELTKALGDLTDNLS